MVSPNAFLFLLKTLRQTFWTVSSRMSSINELLDTIALGSSHLSTQAQFSICGI